MKMKHPPLIPVLLGMMIASGCRSTSPPGAGAASAGGAQPIPTPQADTAEAYDLIRNKKYIDAEPLLKRAIDTDPLYGPAHNDLGLVCYRTDRLYQAACELETAARLMPHAPVPRNNLGLVLERAGRLTDAMSQYKEAVQLDPDNAEFLGNLARARVRLGLRDAETKKALADVMQKDDRPQWRHWAEFTLLRMQGDVSQTQPATEPVN